MESGTGFVVRVSFGSGCLERWMRLQCHTLPNDMRIHWPCALPNRHAYWRLCRGRASRVL